MGGRVVQSNHRTARTNASARHQVQAGTEAGCEGWAKFSGLTEPEPCYSGDPSHSRPPTDPWPARHPETDDPSLRRIDRPLYTSLMPTVPPTRRPLRTSRVRRTSTTAPDGDSARRLRRQVEHAIEQLAALSGSTLPPGEFYEELLRKGLDGIDAPAGAVWLKSPQGFLQQQCQQNISPSRPGRPARRPAGPQPAPALRLREGQARHPRPTAAGRGRPGGRQPDRLRPGRRPDPDRGQPDPRPRRDLPEAELEPAGPGHLHDPGGRVRLQLPAQHQQPQGRRPGAGLDPARGLHPAGPRLAEPDRGGLRRRQRGPPADRLRPHLRRRPARAQGDHRGRQRGRRRREGQHAHPPDAHPVRRRPPVGREARLPRHRDDTLPPKVLEALDDYLAEQNPKLLVLVPIRDEREKPKEGSKEAPSRSGRRC